jgi:hypothetical protein
MDLYDVELVDLALARVERLAVCELAHDAANGPHVHGLAVVGIPEQQLRRAVPAPRRVTRAGRRRGPKACAGGAHQRVAT